MERLQKVIANRGYCSRRKAERLIEQGRVSVNQVVVTELGTKVSVSDVIEVEGITLEKQLHVYYLMNKPRGYISTVEDEFQRKSVVDLIETAHVNERVYPVGRLDKDTTGILLLTNDGSFMNAMTHPKFHIPKVYEVTVKGLIKQHEAKALLEGVFIARGVKVFADTVDVIVKNKQAETSKLHITIHDGKYHQVKKMFQKIGFPVRKLKRICYGNIELGTMPMGSVRPLKNQEVSQLLLLANKGKN